MNTEIWSDEELAGQMEVIGELMALRRERMGLTQEQVAEKLGIGNDAVSRMERGTVEPSAGRLLNMARILNCAPAEFLMLTNDDDDELTKAIRFLVSLASPEKKKFILAVLRSLDGRDIKADNHGVAYDATKIRKPEEA